MRNDGAVVYLNGTEVYRSNMPGGSLTYATPASSTVGPSDKSTWYLANLNSALLVNGSNVLAVEIHLAGPSSSDIGFDAQLIATTKPAPTAPAAPSNLIATAVSSSQINLTWTDNSDNETGFIIERSPDGSTNWTQIATPAANATSYSNTGLSPSTTYYYRIRATNGVGPSSNSNIAHATTASATGLPAPWVDGDIGSPSPAGSASYTGGTYTAQGAGSDIWTTADSFNYVYQPWTGDGQIIAKVNTIQNTNGWAKAGVMFRDSLAAGAETAAMVITPTNGSVFIYRTATNGSANGDFDSAPAAPYWVKVIRSGSSFSGYESIDGTTWALVGTMNISMTNPTIYVGLLVCSKATGTLNTATFTNVTTSTSTSTTLAVSAQTAQLQPLALDANSAQTATTTETEDPTTALDQVLTVPTTTSSAATTSRRESFFAWRDRLGAMRLWRSGRA